MSKKGFGNKKTREKARKTMEEKYDVDNYMKTDEAKQELSDRMKKENNPERARKISESLRGQESKLKGRDYEDIHGEEKSEEIKQQKRDKLLNKQEVIEKFSKFGFELMEEYGNARTRHQLRCINCGKIHYYSWNKIQQRKITCDCDEEG